MAASVRVILSAKAICVAEKNDDVVEKAQTASITVRKSLGDMEIYCNSGADVLGQTDYEGAGGTGGAKEVGDVGS